MDPYVPEQLPLQDLDHSRLIQLVGQANAELARYDGMLRGIVNPSILLSPLTTQEAVLSSKIEGTQATLDEVLEHEAGRKYDDTKTQDIQEIINYRQALMQSKDQLADRTITLSFIKQLHGILMNSVRGHNKEPGRFRREQNWIGSAGCSIEHATYVPPSPLQLQDYLESWEAYLKHEEFDPLTQTAIIHAQFELIHPFKDGNGRIGRLLVPLFLYSKKVLTSPMFYLSSYLEANRTEYYERLQAISRKKDWNSWIIFFLNAVLVQARDNGNKVREIMALYETMKERIRAVTHSQYAIQILDAVFERPIFQSSDFVRSTGIHKQTALPLLRQLRSADILTVIREASGRRPAVMAFPALINIAEGQEVI